MKEERDNTWGGGGLPTLPGLYLSTFQPSQRGFFRVHTFVWRERAWARIFKLFRTPVINSMELVDWFCIVLRIRDPRWIKSGSGSGIWNEQPGSYFLELRNHFLGLKYLNSLMGIRDSDPGWKKFGSGNRDQGLKKVGSGIRKNIPDQQHWFWKPFISLPHLHYYICWWNWFLGNFCTP